LLADAFSLGDVADCLAVFFCSTFGW
jgi:hypothetical protein